MAFLAFVHLVGVVYMLKYASGFTAPTPATYFNHFYEPGIVPQLQHTKWLSGIR